MAFDFFTQPQGAAINVSLFPDAATKGIAAGNALPTALTSAIQGGLKGIQEGQQIVQNSLNIEKTQNEINQEPINNAIKQEQLDLAKLQNEALAKKVQDQAESEALLEEIAPDLGAPTLATKEKILSDPRVQQKIVTNKDFADTVFGGLFPVLTPEERQTAFNRLDVLKAKEIALREQSINRELASNIYKDSDESLEKFLKDTTFANAISNNPNNITGLLKRVEAVPAGTYTVSQDPETGDYVRVGSKKNKLSADDLAKSQWEFYDGSRLVATGNKTNADNLRAAQLVSNSAITSFMERMYPEGIPERLKTAPGSSAILGSQNQQATNNENQNAGTTEAEQPPVTPAPGPQPGEAVERQGLDYYNSLAPGNGSLESLAAKKRAYQNLNAANNKNVQVQNAQKQQQAVIEQKKAQTPTIPDVPGLEVTPEFKPISYNEPSSALSQVAGFNTALTIPIVYRPSKTTAESILTNPLLNDKPALIKGLAAVESGGRSSAVSPTGVRGLLQVTKGAAAQYGLNRDIPAENVKAGSFLLADNMITFKGNLPLALAAYNAGPEPIKKAIVLAGSADWNRVKIALKEFLPEKKYNEVIEYPEKVISAASHFTSESDYPFVQLLQQNRLLTNV